MKVAVDTNVLLRLIVQDDERQTLIAASEIAQAEVVVIPLLALCETAWVMTRSYRFSRLVVAEKLRALLAIPNVEYDVATIEGGLAVLELGGDFADGVIALQGEEMRADTLITFDRQAAKLLTTTGHTVRLLT
ncbi:type II toxin-antitoxin system VapC family toxin [Brevundimonas sp.]|uniref:type II toxin-antitoxin system VapC family toxin n=1 Tax=Brevundimonas sp. TaxID=1871086 RepID=UPI003783EF0E